MRICPRCSSSNVETERRPDGNSRCIDCHFLDSAKEFKTGESYDDDLRVKTLKYRVDGDHAVIEMKILEDHSQGPHCILETIPYPILLKLRDSVNSAIEISKLIKKD